MKEINFRVQNDIKDKKGSKIEKYCDLIVGQRGLLAFLKYELIILFCSPIPGAIGLLLRSKLYPLLLKKCGTNVVFGTNVIFRHPNKIEIGADVIVDDNCLLDAKGENNQGIKIGSGTFIGRNTILSCKNGDIELKENVNIGFNCEIYSGSCVTLQENVLVGAYSYFIGGDHVSYDIEQNIASQKGVSYGIEIEKDCWFGASVKVQDHVKIGAHSIIGTSAVVTKDIAPYSVAVGIPAKVIKTRTQS